MAVIRKCTKEVIVGGSGGMVPHKNLHALRLLLVVSESASTNNSSQHTFSIFSTPYSAV